MIRDFMDEFYEKMRADNIGELSAQRNDDCEDYTHDYEAAKQALIDGLGLGHLFNRSRELTPEEEKVWILFDKVERTELLARDATAKGAYLLGAEDREKMLR